MNYSNLNDVEFEYLCKDVMSKRLSKSLQRFASGRDGGIDLTDNVFSPQIVIQVKHYVKSDFPKLIRSLKDEIPKVKKISPKHYYVCCSKELTPGNKRRIFELFSPYMDSEENIITALELDDFLTAPDNIDILRKHFKLWIDSTNILTDILSSDIFVDSESLIAGINDEANLFVRTHAFNRAVECLEKKNVLIIIGNPGVGKTVTSKMLVLYYASKGYRVRYTTDGAYLSSLKKSLSQSSDTKEVILLDDCFGQAYFNMKETQENELLSLIRTANQNPNKRLILNSRISIYQEARDRSISLVRSYEKREYRAYVLDMEQLSAEEKARIFYNHLFFYGVPPQYFESLKVDKKYRAIVKHKNYNPRIIEFVCTPHQYEKISPSKYADFILDCLNNPEQIWKNEYERRLAEVDRLLLTTLYSLSDTSVPFDMVKECFENRITRHASFDKSINHFNQALNRLTGSMIKIVDVRGVRGLAAANPSVNDFIRAHLESNGPERQDLLLTASSIRQFKRLLGVIAFEEQMSKSFVDHSVLSYVFENNSQKTGYIAVWCAKNKIYDAVYGPYIVDFVYNIRDVNMYESEIEKISNIAKYLFEKEFCLFYGINEVSFELPRFYKMLDELQLDEIVQIVSHIDWIIEQTKRSAYIKEIRAILRENIEAYCTDVPADAYDINIADIVEECHYTDERGGKLDGDEAISMVEQKIEDCVSDELFDILSALPDDIDPQNNLSSNVKISINGAESAVLDYLRDDYDEDMFFEDRENQYMDDKLLDSIFNR